MLNGTLPLFFASSLAGKSPSSVHVGFGRQGPDPNTLLLAGATPTKPPKQLAVVPVQVYTKAAPPLVICVAHLSSV
jgi:hypothetical protein